MADPTLRTVIDASPLPEVLAVLERLRKLPEFGMGRQLALIREFYTQAEAAEIEYRQRCRRVRNEAHDLLAAVMMGWPDDEVEAATGYRL
jgi:hypothetical protein